MNRYALIRGGVIATIVEHDELPTIGGTWVDVTGKHVGPGYSYNLQTDQATAPVVTVSLPQREFWKRFTAAERELLQDKLSTGTQNAKNKLNAFRDYVSVGGNVELNDDYIIASVAAMEAVGVIGAGRAAQILA